jgi:2-dehydro-3-deoxygalactonokinase
MKNFLSCDWGTSTFRLRLLDAGTGELLEEIKSDYGISKIHQDWLQNTEVDKNRIRFYKSHLATALKELRMIIEPGSPIIISGMASSSIGIIELPYRPLPFTLTKDLPIWQLLEKDEHLQHPVYIVSGFKTNTDVMRGEETMLVGINNSGDDEICILPGTHSKHAYIKSGVLTEFKTYITGELFSVMSKHSILSNSVVEGEDISAFELGLDEATSGNLLNQFFKVRTRQLLEKTTGVSNYQFLSGLLIGTELRELRATKYKIRLICDGSIAKLYSHALMHFGLNVIETSATEMLIRGHLRIVKGILKQQE